MNVTLLRETSSGPPACADYRTAHAVDDELIAVFGHGARLDPKEGNGHRELLRAIAGSLGLDATRVRVVTEGGLLVIVVGRMDGRLGLRDLASWFARALLPDSVALRLEL